MEIYGKQNLKKRVARFILDKADVVSVRIEILEYCTEDWMTKDYQTKKPSIAHHFFFEYLGLDVNRFRGAYFKVYDPNKPDGHQFYSRNQTSSPSEKLVLHVCSRTGGGNREEYSHDNWYLEESKYCIRANEDGFDCTYMDFYFDLEKWAKDFLEEAGSS